MNKNLGLKNPSFISSIFTIIYITYFGRIRYENDGEQH